MNPESRNPTSSIFSMEIVTEQDIVTARQRARQLASLLAFHPQDQVRIATGVSEVTRNVHQYAGKGTLEFSLDLYSKSQIFWISVSDRGPGIANPTAILEGNYVSKTGMGIGLSGTQRLMDCFEIDSVPGHGTTVRFGKIIPARAVALQQSEVRGLGNLLVGEKTSGTEEELHRQNRDLLLTLETLRFRESELEKRQKELSTLNLELEETNRGVVALYAELDEKANALRRADETKSHFLWHVSHEFRTPLNAIQALTHLLLAHTDGPLGVEQEKQVNHIRRAAGELTEMVDDLLDFGKVESGRVELRLSRLDVSQLLGGVRALMRPLATSEAVQLVFEEPAQPIFLNSDGNKVSQVLRNLISNALKFTQAGHVRVSARSTEEGVVLFVVSDTGIGIAPEDLSRIFHDFEQIESPLQKSLKGTGLGLSLSRKLAGLLGGTLEVTSTLGSGSTFTLSLPARLEPAPETPASAPVENTDIKSVLLIDDDERSRYLARQLFSGTKHQILEARNGIEGAERARFERPALIVLDLSMPDRTGFEVLEELKSDPATRDIAVVIHSSRELRESDYQSLSNRILTFLPKRSGGRRDALVAIRTFLGEPNLFTSEPEFLSATNVR